MGGGLIIIRIIGNSNPNAGEKGYSSHQSCKSVKAFRRKLKKAPKGVKFILVSKWEGYNVEGIGSEDYI